jgi:hypothetical protein
MNPSDLEFEQRLKQLRPAGCESLASDTFYQAGWNAALQSTKSQRRQSAMIRPYATSFAAGLISGLVVIAGAWQFSNQQPEPADANNTIAETNAPRAIEISSNDVTVEHQSQPTAATDAVPSPSRELFDEYSLLATLTGLDQTDFAPRETQMLSPVARRSWSNVLLAEPRFSLPETANASTSTSSLRSFPATREILESLL